MSQAVIDHAGHNNSAAECSSSGVSSASTSSANSKSLNGAPSATCPMKATLNVSHDEQSQEQLANMLRSLIANFCDKHFVKHMQRSNNTNKPADSNEIAKTTIETTQVVASDKVVIAESVETTSTVVMTEETVTTTDTIETMRDASVTKLDDDAMMVDASGVAASLPLSPPTSNSAPKGSSGNEATNGVDNTQNTSSDDQKTTSIDGTSTVTAVVVSTLSPSPSDTTSSDSNPAPSSMDTCISHHNVTSSSSSSSASSSSLDDDAAALVGKSMRELAASSERIHHQVAVTTPPHTLWSTITVGADKLEIFGSIHVRSNNVRLLSCLIDEQLSLVDEAYSSASSSVSSNSNKQQTMLEEAPESLLRRLRHHHDHTRGLVAGKTTGCCSVAVHGAAPISDDHHGHSHSRSRHRVHSSSSNSNSTIRRIMRYQQQQRLMQRQMRLRRSPHHHHGSTQSSHHRRTHHQRGGNTLAPPLSSRLYQQLAKSNVDELKQAKTAAAAFRTTENDEEEEEEGEIIMGVEEKMKLKASLAQRQRGAAVATTNGEEIFAVENDYFGVDYDPEEVVADEDNDETGFGSKYHAKRRSDSGLSGQPPRTKTRTNEDVEEQQTDVIVVTEQPTEDAETSKKFKTLHESTKSESNKPAGMPQTSSLSNLATVAAAMRLASKKSAGEDKGDKAVVDDAAVYEDPDASLLIDDEDVVGGGSECEGGGGAIASYYSDDSAAAEDVPGAKRRHRRHAHRGRYSSSRGSSILHDDLLSPRSFSMEEGVARPTTRAHRSSISPSSSVLSSASYSSDYDDLEQQAAFADTYSTSSSRSSSVTSSTFSANDNDSYEKQYERHHRRHRQRHHSKRVEAATDAKSMKMKDILGMEDGDKQQQAAVQAELSRISNPHHYHHHRRKQSMQHNHPQTQHDDVAASKQSTRIYETDMDEMDATSAQISMLKAQLKGEKGEQMVTVTSGIVERHPSKSPQQRGAGIDFEQQHVREERRREDEYLMRKYKRRFPPYTGNTASTNGLDSQMTNDGEGPGSAMDANLFLLASSRQHSHRSNGFASLNGETGSASQADYHHSNGYHHHGHHHNRQLMGGVNALVDRLSPISDPDQDHKLRRSNERSPKVSGASDTIPAKTNGEVNGGEMLNRINNLSPSSSSSSGSAKPNASQGSATMQANGVPLPVFHHASMQQQQNNAVAVLAAAAAAQHHHHNGHSAAASHHHHHAQSVAALLADMQQQNVASAQQQDVAKALAASLGGSSHHHRPSHATQSLLSRFSNGGSSQNDLMAAVIAQQQQQHHHRSLIDAHHQNGGHSGNGYGPHGPLYSRYSSHLNAAVAAAAAAAASSATAQGGSSSQRRANSVESDTASSPHATTPAPGTSGRSTNDQLSGSCSISSAASSSSSTSSDTYSKYNMHERNDDIKIRERSSSACGGVSSSLDANNPNGNEKVRLVSGYDVFISTNDLNACNDDRGSATRLLRNLMDVFFDKSTLAKSSINGTGRITNTLDKHVISSLFAYVKIRYSDVPHSQLTRAATDKCVQTRRNFRKKIKAAQSYFGMFPSMLVSRPSHNMQMQGAESHI